MAKVKLVGKVLGVMLMLAACLSGPEAQSDSPAYQAGLEAMGERDIPAAIPKLEEALQSTEDPAERANINLLLGLGYMWNDQLDKAIAASEAVMTFDPDLTVSFPDQGMHHLNPTAGLADCYRMKALKGGESASAAWASALQWAQKCLEQNPDAGAQMLIAQEARGKLGQAQAQEMSLEEARTMVRAADEAYDRGDYTEALRLARKVLEERGDIYVLWPGEGARHPAPEADIYDTNEFIRAQMVAAQETGAEILIKIAGTTPRKIILYSLYKMKDWEATARLAEELLREAPDGSVPRSILKVARAQMAEARQAQAPLVTYPEGRSLYVIGEAVQREGQLWVTLRGVEEVRGACVTWDPATGSATMLVGNHTFTVWPGRQEVLVDGALRPLTAAPYLDKDRLRVPVHFLARALDREVKWEAESRLLHIVPKIAWVR